MKNSYIKLLRLDVTNMLFALNYFVKLIESMNYKSIRKNDKIFFKYMPKKFKKKNKFKESKKDNPFYILNQLSIK